MKRTLHYILSIIILSFTFIKLSAQEPEQLQIKVYPTEVRDGYFFIEIDKVNPTELLHIQVSNLLGSEVSVQHQIEMNGKHRISFQGRPTSGIYIVRVTQGRKQTTQRILVRGN